MYFSIITIKMPFLNSLLISLYYKSINRTSYTRINISTCRDYLVDIPAKLADMPAELVDMPVEVMWFSIVGFLFVGYFWGRP